METADYELLCEQMRALADGVTCDITNLANASALLYDAMPDLNWAGFYLLRDGVLMLGPFQGKPACTRIALGRGVCGTAAERDAIQLVADVHQFPGHIACDSASNSEVVIPIHKSGALFGVLDIDSPKLSRFTEDDAKGLTRFVRVLEEILNETSNGEDAHVCKDSDR